MPIVRELSQIFESVLDGFVVFDAAGGVEHLNSAACRLLDVSPGMIRGAPPESLPNCEIFAAEVRLALAGGRSVVANEVPLPREGRGEDLLVDVSVAALRDERGAIDGAILSLRDRTIGATLRDAREVRIQDEAYGRMASGIAHEIKNPLGGIRGAAELLALRASDDRARQSADLIVREVDRIAALIDDFAVFSDGSRLRLAQINIHQVLDDVIEVSAHDPIAGGIQIERHFDPSLPELFADGDRLRQVFLNLVRNALEAIGDDPGRVSVSSRLRLDHHIDAGAGKRAPTVVIEIADTGCGIPDPMRGVVGTPFFSTKARGTGLGLAISRHFVAELGGSLQIFSREPQGSVVRVSLPLRRNE